MKLTDFIATLSNLAKEIPDAEVLVDGWPVEIDPMPAYYDGPSKRYDADTNTLIFIRTGAKIILRGLDMEALDELHPGMELNTSALQDWQAARYHEKLSELRQAPNSTICREGSTTEKGATP
jgi:hypothetical protein